MTTSEIIAFNAGAEQGRQWVANVRRGMGDLSAPLVHWTSEVDTARNVLGLDGFDRWRRRGFISETSKL